MRTATDVALGQPGWKGQLTFSLQLKEVVEL